MTQPPSAIHVFSLDPSLPRLAGVFPSATQSGLTTANARLSKPPALQPMRDHLHKTIIYGNFCTCFAERKNRTGRDS